MSANQKLFALLIDGDNVSPTLITQILDKLKEYGEPFICRVFANRTSIVAWDAAVLKHSLGSIRVPNNTKGMNAVDISIVIAAMDLHYNRPELTGFCIVSSDGDFTELAIYLKERHKFVLGIGDERTPDSLANACSKFVNIKDLPKAQATTPPPHATKPAIPKSPSPPTPAAKVTTPKAPAPKSATPKAPTLKAPAPKASVSKAPVHIATPKLPAPKVSVPKASTPTKPPTSKMPTPKAPAPKTSALKEAEPKTPMPQLPAPKVPTPQPPITAKPVPETPKASTLTSEAWFTRPYYNTLKTQGGWIQGGETSEDMISLDDRFEMSFVRAYDNSSKGEGGWVSLREIREGMKNMDSEFELREYQSTRLFADWQYPVSMDTKVVSEIGLQRPLD